MREEQDTPEPGRRRFVLTALSVGSGAVLGTMTGCTPSTPDPEATDPGATPAAAPAPVGQAETSPGSWFPESKDPADFIKHGDSPLTLETKREKLGTLLTASSLLFVRQNLPLPPSSFVSDRAGWTTEVKGVRRPGEIRVDELDKLGLTTMATVLQCSGNGRKYFGHDPSGSPWGVGASGCVMWTGVPVRDVVRHFAGVERGARYLTTTGGEPLPAGIDRDQVVVERSIPLAKALDDAFLAWQMNGEPIPLEHGGPLRLIVPGYFGCNQIKFVRRLAFTKTQGPAKIQQTGYRMRPIGQNGAPDQPALWEMPVKSFITLPTQRTPVVAGRFRVIGVAFGGTDSVAKVEVSTDGRRWRRAAFLGPDLGRYAWRVFAIDIERAPGSVTLYSRATTVRGRAQPETRFENERGYANNSWRDLGVMVQVCAEKDLECLTPPPAPTEVPRGPKQPVVLSDAGKRGREIFRQNAVPSCSTCHTLSDAEAVAQVGPNLDELGHSVEQVRAAVTNGVGAMPPFGQTLTPDQIDDVAQYVFEATRRN